MIIDPDTLAWLAALEILLVACLCGLMIVVAALAYRRDRDVAATTGRLDDHSAILANLTIRVANLETVAVSGPSDPLRYEASIVLVDPADSVPPVPDTTCRALVFDEPG